MTRRIALPARPLGSVASGIGAPIDRLLRFQRRTCPRCGLNRGPEAGSEALARRGDRSAALASPEAWSREWSWILGAAVAVRTRLFVLGVLPPAMFAGGASALGLAGALSGTWASIKMMPGFKGSPRQLERAILRLAVQRGGRLTASEVAAYADLSPDVAKKLLDGMEIEDSQRVRSNATDDEVVAYEFPESLRRPGN